MEKIIIQDIFLGDYPISQYFGQRPDYYKRWGLNGHNGVDFALPLNTPVSAGVNGSVFETGFDNDGYGLYVVVLSNKPFYRLLFAHLSHIYVKKGDPVSSNRVIGLSGTSGISTGPHLHFGIAPCNEQGSKLYPNNGYSGYVDPLNPRVVNWVIKDPQGIYLNFFKS